jgi:short-subunit dehydrogenase
LTKRILITGAGSGFGKAAALGMAKNGHDIIAAAQISPQVMPLREEAKALGLNNLRVERLDLTDPTTSPRRSHGTSMCCGTMPVWAKPAQSGKSQSTSCARIMRSTFSSH